MGPKIVLATFGSYGDLHPFIALALELKALGARPVIVTTSAYREKIEREGLAFHPAAPEPEQVERDTGLCAEQLAAAVTNRSVAFILDAFVLPYLAQACDDVRAAAADADLVVVSTLALAAQVAADALQKPSVCVALSPVVLFSAEDPPVLEELPALPLIGRLLGPRLTERLYDAGRRRFAGPNATVEAERRRHGLPPGRGDAMLDGPYRADEVIALYSPLLGGARRRPPVPTTIAGFAFFDRDGPAGQPLPAEAEAFLTRGEAPLVFTLGSFAVLAAERFYEDAVAAGRVLGRRAVLLVGRDDEAALRARLGGPEVLVLGYAPHSQLFPRAAAVIHHGGVGTTGQALRSGAPQLVCPIFGDQPDNAYRVRRLGVGAALPFRRFTPRRAAKALKPLLENPAVRERAKAVAATVAREDGARIAAEHILRRVAAARRK